MSEANVFGIAAWSISGYDIGIDNRQYAIFQLKPEYVNSYKKSRFNYWVKSVSVAARFVYLGGWGDSSHGWPANPESGVRPRFLIG